MKFSIYKASQENRSLGFFGTMEASSLEVAGDLLFKVLRRSLQKNGDFFLILPDSSPHPDKISFENGIAFQILQYRDIN